MIARPGERRTVTTDDANVRVAWLDPAQVVEWTRDRPPASWLAAEEIEALDGMSKRAAGDRLASRIALKLLVREEERFAEVPLDQIVTHPDEHGRPHLVLDGRDHAMPSISLSHSRGWGAAALSWSGLVGIDVEHLRSGLPRVKERLLGPAQVASSDEEILRLWVLKEAAAKAWGAGLDLPLADVQIEIHDGDARIRMPPAVSRWDASGDLDGIGRVWMLPGTSVAFAHFLARDQDF